MLFDPSEHVSVTSESWSHDQVLKCANSIFDFLCDGRALNGLWTPHPSEESEIPFNKSLYMGATGTLWALCELSKRLQRSLPFDPADLIAFIHKQYLDAPDTGAVVPSFLLGESAILLLQQKLSPSELNLNRLKSCIRDNTRNPVNEVLWGCPGTMLAALATDQIDLYRESADYLFEVWSRNLDEHWVWTQDLYGKIRQFVGAGHGFFGNVHVLLKGQVHLTEIQRELLLERTAKTTIASAQRESGFANWNCFFDIPPKQPLVQWCHGAPGIINALSSFPKDYSSEVEKVLLEAGELVWAAGPLEQGIALCHGTDGNGFALLRLFERTQDELWLERARKFAAHAIHQRNGRYTLWTGEAGLALFLLASIDGRGGFPSLDYF